MQIKTEERYCHRKRHFDIVMGIVQGLVYPHQDSRLQIIHWDLKASNILLDGKPEPQNFRLWLGNNFWRGMKWKQKQSNWNIVSSVLRL